MGCFVSTQKETGVGNRRRPSNIGEVSVFVPGFRVPKPVDFSQCLGEQVAKCAVERLSALRTQIVVMVGHEALHVTRSRRKSITQHGGSTLTDLQQVLEDYLPVLLGLVKDGSPLQHKVQFCWVNQEDAAEETVVTNAWYEVLSVLHLMAMLSLSQANILLLPRISTDGYQPKVTDESRRASVEIFLKAAGYLDCAIRHVFPQLSVEIRRSLPVDLSEGVIRALSLQALGQGVDIQLGLAIDSAKATLAVKRRLACEMVKYWQQAQDNIMNQPLTNGWGEKHQLFIKWKYTEAKVRTSKKGRKVRTSFMYGEEGLGERGDVDVGYASLVVEMVAEPGVQWGCGGRKTLFQAAAYYYHGIILDEGNTEKSHGMAIASLQAADEYLKECKKAGEAFNMAPPQSRNPPLWGTMKYLSDKIPKDTSSKVRINRDLYTYEKIMETAPTLPDFALALKPDEYQLPTVHPCWNEDSAKIGQQGHL
ncbi:hypothetical protein KSS87_021829 [Heliosperma pusillum]|nr:hypothetical protein KSS87_021829 [Heliosperma pusillum]